MNTSTSSNDLDAFMDAQVARVIQRLSPPRRLRRQECIELLGERADWLTLRDRDGERHFDIALRWKRGSNG